MSTEVLSHSMIKPRYWPAPPMATSREFVASPSPEYRAIIAEVAKLQTLPENWDSSGGLPVSKAAARASFDVLREGADRGAIAHVMPLSDGSMLAEWHFECRLLQIEWAPDGSAEYNIAMNFELLSEGPLPSDARGLFSFLLGDLRLQPPAET